VSSSIEDHQNRWRSSAKVRAHPGVAGQARGVFPLENLRVETGGDKQTVIGTGNGGRVFRLGALYPVHYFPGHRTDDSCQREDAFWL